MTSHGSDCPGPVLRPLPTVFPIEFRGSKTVVTFPLAQIAFDGEPFVRAGDFVLGNDDQTYAVDIHTFNARPLGTFLPSVGKTIDVGPTFDGFAVREDVPADIDCAADPAPAACG